MIYAMNSFELRPWLRLGILSPLTSHRLHSGPPVYKVNFGSLLAAFVGCAAFKTRTLVENGRDDRILRRAAMLLYTGCIRSPNAMVPGCVTRRRSELQMQMTEEKVARQ